MSAQGMGKGGSQLMYPLPTFTPCEGEASALLVIILSCASHRDHWPALRRWGEEASGEGGYLILSADPSQGSAYDLDLSSNARTLVVGGTDTYEALPEKLLRAFHVLLADGRLAHVTHVQKIDDEDVQSNWLGLNVTKMESQLRGLDADYIAPAQGALAWCCQPARNMWYGLWKASNSSALGRYWNMRFASGLGPSCEGEALWAGGGKGWILSRHALRLIGAAWPLANATSFSHRFFHEDYAWGEILRDHGVFLTAVTFEDVPQWAACSSAWDGQLVPKLNSALSAGNPDHVMPGSPNVTTCPFDRGDDQYPRSASEVPAESTSCYVDLRVPHVVLSECGSAPEDVATRAAASERGHLQGQHPLMAP